jgi:AcrR family transcriptional regulator
MPRQGLDTEIVTEAAARIVDADGLAALTLARLATELGVAAPSLYKHVAGLDDLLLRVTTLSIRRLTDDLTAAVLGRSGRQALLSVAQAYRSFAIKHASLYALTQSGIDPNSTVQRTEAARAVEILGAAIRSYNVPDDRLVHAIRVVRAGLHGFADIEARGGFQMPLSVDESFLVLIEALDASLSSLGKGTKEN